MITTCVVCGQVACEKDLWWVEDTDDFPDTRPDDVICSICAGVGELCVVCGHVVPVDDIRLVEEEEEFPEYDYLRPGDPVCLSCAGLEGVEKL
jgi:hypothetical protein